MKKIPLPRLDRHPELRSHLLQYCRLQPGEIWIDPQHQHRVACLDAACHADTHRLMAGHCATLAIHDPPYNLVAFEQTDLDQFIAWCKQWVDTTHTVLSDDASLYVWLGADQTAGFQPLPDFMLMMRNTPFSTRSYITMRNQRGYGTQKNWMAVRQELLYYTKGAPFFHVEADYTDIPKILRGYYKKINETITENTERGKSENIRAGNVWVDVQQVFYRMEENVNGCYAQKPLKSCERIIKASSQPGDVVIDFFCHSGTTLLSADICHRRCFTIDIDPVYCEIAIRRLEQFRRCGRKGWQNSNPFEAEMITDTILQDMLCIQKNTRKVGQIACKDT